jgi:hypothetical protein
MGDKSPKAKQRSQNQKNAMKKQHAANARSKQSAQSQPPIAKDDKK